MIVYEYTPLIRTSDHQYPVYLYNFRMDNPNVSIGTWIYSENLVEFGYFPVIPTEKPEGDVVTEGEPKYNEETQEWEQVWEVRHFTDEEIAHNLEVAKSKRKNEAQGILANDLDTGIPYPYGEQEYKVRVKSFDMATLLSIKNVLNEDGEDSTSLYPFQFLDGYKDDFSHSEMEDLVNNVTRAHYELMKRYWRYRDSVDDVTTIDSIPDLPSTFL